jgi:hypothetical protein
MGDSSRQFPVLEAALPLNPQVPELVGRSPISI